jgi:hypothetical protein
MKLCFTWKTNEETIFLKAKKKKGGKKGTKEWRKVGWMKKQNMKEDELKNEVG